MKLRLLPVLVITVPTVALLGLSQMASSGGLGSLSRLFPFRPDTQQWPNSLAQGGNQSRTPPLQMSATTSNYLNRCCPPGNLNEIKTTLARSGTTSLGPIPLTVAEQNLLIGPAQQIQFQPQRFASSGNGTANSPYINAIANFLKQQKASSVSILVPAGVYQEMNLTVPSGTWLVSRGKTTLVAPSGAGPVANENGKVKVQESIIILQGNTGLVGFELDGSRANAISGISVAPEASKIVIANNNLRDLKRHGIWGKSKTQQVTLLNNQLDRIGFSGIRNGSEWLVKNTTIRYAGILRPRGGGGDDGIIPNTGSSNSQIVNNLVIVRRNPHGRHGIAAQKSDRNLFQSNLIIVEGQMRGGLVLSDGSFNNRVIGNVVVGQLVNGVRSRIGLLVNGGNNTVRGNAVVGFDTGILLYDKVKKAGGPAKVNNEFSNNYVVAINKGVVATPETNRVSNNQVNRFPNDQTGKREKEDFRER